MKVCLYRCTRWKGAPADFLMARSYNCARSPSCQKSSGLMSTCLNLKESLRSKHGNPNPCECGRGVRCFSTKTDLEDDRVCRLFFLISVSLVVRNRVRVIVFVLNQESGCSPKSHPVSQPPAYTPTCSSKSASPCFAQREETLWCICKKEILKQKSVPCQLRCSIFLANNRHDNWILIIEVPYIVQWVVSYNDLVHDPDETRILKRHGSHGPDRRLA